MLIEFIKPDFNFIDDRGSLTQLVHGGWNQVNYITSVRGSVRGDHYHVLNKEAFYVISGGFRLALRHKDTNESAEYDIKAGEFFIIHPNVYHSFTYTADTALISMYNHGVELVNGKKDIIR